MIDFSTLKSLTIPEGVVTKIAFGSQILWEKILNKLPDEYQEVEYVRALSEVGAYIDLGFSFDTRAKICLTQHIDGTSATYVFGAAENSGTLRCMLSSPYDGVSRFYGSGSGGYITASIAHTTGANEFEITLEHGNLSLLNKTLGESISNGSQREQVMTNNLYLLGQNYNGTARFGGVRTVSKFKYYDKDNKLICDLIPCYKKSNSEIGMYDVVRRTFLTNAGTGSFVRGADVGGEDVGFINWWLCSTENDGVTIYNNGVGYKDGYRVRSGGAEAEAANAVCSGYIPFKKGNTLYIYPAFTGVNAENAINFSDATFTNLGQINDNGTTYGICSGNGSLYKPTVINNVSVLTYADNFDSSITYVRITNQIKTMPSQYSGNGVVTIDQEISF